MKLLQTQRSYSSCQDPTQITASLAGGWRLWKSGEFERADVLCRHLLQSDPDRGELLHLAGLVSWKLGRFDQAQTLLERAIAIEPNQPLHYSNLGVVLNDMANFEQATIHLSLAVQLSPDFYEAHNNLGLSLYHQNKLSLAAKHFTQAIELSPNHAPSIANLGMLRLAQGKYDDAIKLYKKAVTIDSEQAKWWANLGAAYLESNNFSNCAHCSLQAYRLDPSNPEYANSAGVALRAMDDLEGSIKLLESAHCLAPDHGDVLANLCIALQQTCQWAKFDSYIQRLDKLTRQSIASGQLPAERPMFNIRRTSDRDLNHAVAQAWSREASRRSFRVAKPFKHQYRQALPHRITLGYLSHDFRDHPVTHQLLPLFGLHDRNRFRVITFSMGPDDQSEYRTRIAADSDMFIDINGMDIHRAATEIHSQGVDILIDLMGHSHRGRMDILALRPAPVQISYLGFLSTSGADFVDYTIADSVVVPDHHASQFSERLVYMPHCYQMSHDEFQRPHSSSSRSQWGLPETGFVFCSFNKPYKIDALLFKRWLSILHQVPESVLWLVDDNPLAKAMLIKAAQDNGVSSRRLIFSTKIALPDHLKRLALADLALDTIKYNGGATTANALWAGLPILTVMGDHWVSRMSASHLLAAGLPELVARDLDEYEQMAVLLAHNPDRLKALQDRLQVNRQHKPIFKAKSFVGDLEAVLEEIWRQYHGGQKITEAV